jgi:hypothetical protein
MVLPSSRFVQIVSWSAILFITKLERAHSFVSSRHTSVISSPPAGFIRVQAVPYTSQLHSTSKKKSVLSPGKGFGKQQQQEDDNKKVAMENLDNNKMSGLFVSVDETTMSSSSKVSSSSSNLISKDMDKPIEERTKDILRQRYGLTTMEEKLNRLEQMDRFDSMQKKVSKLEKAVQKKEEEKSWISLIPPEILAGISTFLKVGTGLSVFVFVLAGIGITWEAWIVSTHPEKDFMSPQVDAFITQVVEPNFTLGLFVLLAFSISLGLLTSAQLGSSSAVYQEKE